MAPFLFRGFFFCLRSLSPAQTADVIALQQRVVELYEEHRAAIVRVNAAYATSRESSPQSEDAAELADAPIEEDFPRVIIGSGFFISREGHILTNASIVNEPDRVWVEHQGVAYAAEVIGTDRPTNISLIRVLKLPASFRFIQLTDAADLPAIGSLVLRISSPLKYDPTPALGMVSGVESQFADAYFPCAYIRTSLHAGPGEGGAAFFDLHGNLVGIQVGSQPDVLASYVLPGRAALRIRDDLLFNGKVKYGWLGFEIREEATVRGGHRLILSKILPATPAETVGLLPGDELVSVGNYDIDTINDLRNATFYSRVGEYVVVRVLRGQEELEYSVRLAPRPANEPREVPLGEAAEVPGLSAADAD